MKSNQAESAMLVIVTLIICGMAQSAFAQTVETRLSTREAYVGMPVVLQLTIENASDFEQPAPPTIDGCDVRAAGAPSRSSQITIINGRRRESHSVSMRYLITPRRADTFEIPAMTVNVNGREQQTQPLRFVASKSETGDLLFVEIEGGKDKVFVGQSLDLTLKIWMKPFVDRQNNIKLSESNMWQAISEQTSWGSFSQRLQELAENNQRPGGSEVVRDNGQGGESAYYLYEISATVYPKQAGKIDADDVQIVVNYPTGIGKSRDPFESIFKDSPFGSRGGIGMSSRMQQMMGDDFFEGSPFGNRLSVTAARPIVGQASVDATEVVPIPTEGRPADYRGAVGRYKIVTQATPTAVSAGDPITLNIGIAGTGPMELVQAPPLSEIAALTCDFKVADQSLAGFVQDETKVFSTAIRPRREGITAIPPIPFSFFDPDTEKFETLMSDPISISVDKSETLALDAIVGNPRRDGASVDSSSAAGRPRTLEPDFANNNSARVLVSQSRDALSNVWLALVVVPPVVWLAILLVRSRETIAHRIPSFKSTSAQCLAAINRAKTSDQVEKALVRFIAQRTQTSISTQGGDEETVVAVGALRAAGLYKIAIEVESFFQNNSKFAFRRENEAEISELQNTARQLTLRLDRSFASMKKSQVRRSMRRGQPVPMTEGRTKRVRPLDRSAQKTSILLIVGLSLLSATGYALADDAGSSISRNPLTSGSAISVAASHNSSVGGDEPVVAENHTHIILTDAQREMILVEASEIYEKAIAIANTDSAEANDLFATAASKYQLLVDSGVRNSQLLKNLGNAYLQGNQLGRAIVSYERAQILDPTNRQIRANLDFANSLVKRQDVNVAIAVGASSDTPTHSKSLGSIVEHLRNINQSLTKRVGPSIIAWTLSLSSLLFWGLLIAGALGYRFPMKRFSIVPLFILMISATSYGLTTTDPANSFDGIIIADNVTLHAGDGEQFAEVTVLQSAQGHRVQILKQRGKWTQVKTTNQHLGWINNDNVARLNPSS